MGLFVVGCLVLLGMYVAGYEHGYTDGVRDTEVRWSDAVGRGK